MYVIEESDSDVPSGRPVMVVPTATSQSQNGNIIAVFLRYGDSTTGMCCQGCGGVDVFYFGTSSFTATLGP